MRVPTTLNSSSREPIPNALSTTRSFLPSATHLLAQGVRSSGHADKASWDAKADFLDALAIGYIEDVLEVHRDHELMLTPAICSCIVDYGAGIPRHGVQATT